ncbi:LysR family transcriptional regulator [Spongiibacter sp. KMU-158]|uniref:LysR family transcriptional regulator n=1 Tax=Spongiibacter pelagi TaxID=2760804 RepID=A0A927GUG0_9GAMM|nr:LysR family transcriptional regulator [Spongiibacter pelagi]MBD2857566.1 LysR family transcriptional regulator [Spongiibacter pelagi]
MRSPRTSLEQWFCFLAVVDEGSYAKAAEAVNKSQSAVTYAVQKLEEQLGVPVFRIEGRKAVLTDAGQVLHRRGRALLEEAQRLESSARIMASGAEPSLRIVADTLFPRSVLLDCVNEVMNQFPETRVECLESVLSGGEEALLERRADLVITGIVPPGFLGDQLLRVRFVAVAHAEHSLHKMERALDYRDLRPFCQVVVRDTGQRRQRDSGWLDAARRLTVSRMEASVEAVSKGMGFAWLPEVAIRQELASGLLKPLPLLEGGERFAELFIVLPERDLAGPAALAAERLIKGAITALSC